MMKHWRALIYSVLAVVATTARSATAQDQRNTGEDCDRGEENCSRPPPGPPPRVATFYPVARFDCYYFRPGAGTPAYIAALNRAFLMPSGQPNPLVGLWRCRQVGQPGESCFTAGGTPLDLARAGIRPGQPVVLVFEVAGNCAEFVIEPSSAFRVRRGPPRKWFVEPLDLSRSRTLNFEIRTPRQNPSHHWINFFGVIPPS